MKRYKKCVKLTWPILISLHVTHGGFSSGTPKIILKNLYAKKLHCQNDVSH